MTTMDDVVAFCLARISEDEALVLERWDSDGKARVATVWTGPEPGYTTVASDSGDDVWIANGREVEDARHAIVLFDPTRALAECTTHRGLIEWAQGIEDLRAMGDPDAPGHPLGEQAVRLLAETWADHEDFRAEWRVS